MSGRGIDLVNSTVPFCSVAIITVSILGKSGWPTSIPSDMMDDSHISFDLPLNQPTLSRDERIFFLRKNSMDVVVMANSAAGQLKKPVKIQYVFPRWRVQHCA